MAMFNSFLYVHQRVFESSISRGYPIVMFDKTEEYMCRNVLPHVQYLLPMCTLW
jgi:hypothetical protein